MAYKRVPCSILILQKVRTFIRELGHAAYLSVSISRIPKHSPNKSSSHQQCLSCSTTSRTEKSTVCSLPCTCTQGGKQTPGEKPLLSAQISLIMRLRMTACASSVFRVLYSHCFRNPSPVKKAWELHSQRWLEALLPLAESQL